jgi:hypothetical protein
MPRRRSHLYEIPIKLVSNPSRKHTPRGANQRRRDSSLRLVPHQGRHTSASLLVLNSALSLARSSHVGRHLDRSRSWLLRRFGCLRLRLRPALKDTSYDLRLLARRHRDGGAACLPHLRPAQAREILKRAKF